jgi:hypothetical protein
MQRGAGVWRLGRLAINPEDYDTLIMMGGGEIFRFEIQYMYRHSCRVTERHPISIKAAALRLDRDCCYRSHPLLNYYRLIALLFLANTRETLRVAESSPMWGC